MIRPVTEEFFRWAILGWIWLWSWGACGCAPTITPADRAELEQHAAQLVVCQERGREAGTYAAYEACKRDAGLQ